MCGLFASIGLAVTPDRIDLVAHRGPDGRGWQEYASPAGPVAPVKPVGPATPATP